MTATLRSRALLTSTAIFAAVAMAAITLYFTWYKPGSERAKCVVTLASIQKAAVSYVGVKQIPPQKYHTITLADLKKEGMIARNLSCPSGGTYILEPVNNDMDTSWLRCTCDPSKGHTLDL